MSIERCLVVVILVVLIVWLISRLALVIQTTIGTRAVLRPIDPGNRASCSGCNQPVKYRARHHQRQVFANVYADNAWDRAEHWHTECYADAGLPHGAP